MAATHSITRVYGKLIGDPLDVKMFLATGWELDEDISNEPDNSLVSAYVRPTVGGSEGSVDFKKEVNADSY